MTVRTRYVICYRPREDPILHALAMVGLVHALRPWNGPTTILTRTTCALVWCTRRRWAELLCVGRTIKTSSACETRETSELAADTRCVRTAFTLLSAIQVCLDVRGVVGG
ncbi:hypothetical protein EXIGLDRAFT_93129 [Exidia glandulosa HHB12029]|uniref:Uncharacterized protein n=1 Tax=Exidia glandulosa HHB12029 TaxID=1314781 RepID=A0A165HAE7_EXIGL|nr:hypothetical protein EXIGLDRAFT_93129 [Exidia glandulosa HHB12029]